MGMALWLLVLLGLGYVSVAASSPIPTHNGTASWVDRVPSRNASVETLGGAEGNKVREGDIIQPADRNAIEDVWSNATVPYVISPELSHRSAEILQAFRMISSTTCIRFVPHQNEWSYINIKTDQGCASPVGMRGGPQPLYFGPPCSVGNLVHELLHTLGFYHEHSRPDRDRYVSINWSKILPGNKDDFKIQHGNTFNQTYDYNSIMHYGPSFFSVDGSPTIITRNAIGQRDHLSELDIKQIKILYNC